MRLKRVYIFIIIFALTLLLPLYGRLLDGRLELSGVTGGSERVELNCETLGDGSYQSYINDSFEDSFPGRKLLLKTRNQLLYSLLNVSPNSNVLIGKDKYLFEPQYILYETQVYAPQDKEYFDSLTDKLSRLKALLEQSDKELYVFITPSKAHYFKEKIPDKLMTADMEAYYDYTNYDKLLESLDKARVTYFDSIAYIDEHLGDGSLEAPLFYKTGTHWSNPWGRTCAAHFLDKMGASSRYDLSRVSVTEKKSAEPIFPDTDLYSSMNLMLDARCDWYDSDVNVTYEGKDKPNFFVRGGSFLGQSISSLISAGIFESDVHLENNNWYIDRYSALGSISDYTAYDELPMDFLLGKSDILVLEINDAAIDKASFGFIDYLLEHPEYLDRAYVAEWTLNQPG